MVARRVLEIRTNDRVSMAYRTVTKREIGEGGTGVLAYSQTTGHPEVTDWLYMNGEEVEALHQFTYEILAGPKTDPRLDVVDAEIGCGYQWRDTTRGDQDCCLIDGHAILSTTIDHVSRTGVPHVMPPF